jgi:serine/threonine protein kinase
MYYLESKNLVHRDISYTNILLRDLSKDSNIKQAKRDEIMRKLGLSEIDSLRRDLGCREGLLIDFDYASLLDLNLNKEAGQADASYVDESLRESQSESQSSLQGSGQGSSQGMNKEDFEVVDVKDDSKTVIQGFHNNISGPRTVSYF